MAAELVLFNFYTKRISVYCIATAVYFVLFMHQENRRRLLLLVPV
jgi:hypothetical protein